MNPRMHVVLLGLSFSLLPASNLSAEPFLAEIQANATLRAGPGDSFAPVYPVKAGATVEVLFCDTRGATSPTPRRRALCLQPCWTAS